MTIAAYQQHPNILAQHYRAFRVQDRLLMTGHSHQAWPDCSQQGQMQAWQDAAEFADQKWSRAEEKAEAVKAGFTRLLDDTDGYIALGQNTFELVVRFISALPLKTRPRLVTSGNEFHSIRRLLNRLAEEGVEIVKVDSKPFDTFVERLADAIDTDTAAVLCSHVFFDSGVIAGNFSAVAQKCLHVGAELLVDVYHSINVVPFTIAEHELSHAFVVGGGYKYCQLGEGNCFLRFPRNSSLRPVITGWFSEFDLIAEAPPTTTYYGGGSARFAGSTYDPTSHYRAAEVFDFFRQQQLTPDKLRDISQHQIQLLESEFMALDLNPDIIRLDETVNLSARAGFLSLYSSQAGAVSQALKSLDVQTDARGNRLRFGPAPYMSDKQLQTAIRTLTEAVNSLD